MVDGGGEVQRLLGQLSEAQSQLHIQFQALAKASRSQSTQHRATTVAASSSSSAASSSSSPAISSTLPPHAAVDGKEGSAAALSSSATAAATATATAAAPLDHNLARVALFDAYDRQAREVHLTHLLHLVTVASFSWKQRQQQQRQQQQQRPRQQQQQQRQSQNTLLLENCTKRGPSSMHISDAATSGTSELAEVRPSREPAETEDNDNDNPIVIDQPNKAIELGQGLLSQGQGLLVPEQGLYEETIAPIDTPSDGDDDAVTK